MSTLTRIISQEYVELGYTHTAPLSTLDISSAFSSPPTQTSHIIHADYEGVYILSVATGIVFKFAPTYHILDARELSQTHNNTRRTKPTEFTWNFGPVPANSAVLTSLKRREAARYNSIEVNRKRTISHEGKVLNTLAEALEREDCLNIIQPHLATPEGIFLPRLECSIQNRIESPSPIPTPLQLRWSLQIARSLAWLEKQDYFHGDLKPANVLLDANSNAILSDFGSADRVGTYLRSGCGVYTSGWGKGGAASEQYAYGWTVYDICNGGHDESLDEVENSSNVVFPETSGMVLGEIVQRCWRREFETVREMEKAVLEVYCSCQSVEAQEEAWRDEGAARDKMLERKSGFRQRMEEVYVGLQGAESAVEENIDAEEERSWLEKEKHRPRATTA